MSDPAPQSTPAEDDEHDDLQRLAEEVDADPVAKAAYEAAERRSNRDQEKSR